MKGLIAADIIASPYQRKGGAFIDNPAFTFFEDFTETVEIRDRRSGRLQNYNFINHRAQTSVNSELALQVSEWLNDTMRYRLTHKNSEEAYIAEVGDYLEGDGNVLVAAAVIGASGLDEKTRWNCLAAIFEYFDMDSLDEKVFARWKGSYLQEESEKLVEDLAMELNVGGDRFTARDFVEVLTYNDISPSHPERLEAFRDKVFALAQKGQPDGHTEEAKNFFLSQIDIFTNEKLFAEVAEEIKVEEIEARRKEVFSREHLLPSESCSMAMRIAAMATANRSYAEMYSIVESCGWGRRLSSEASTDALYASYNDVSYERTLKSAVLAFLSCDSYSKAVRSAICLGGDVTTSAALAGFFNEAKYGAEGKYGLKLQKGGDHRAALEELQKAPSNIPKYMLDTAERIMVDTCGVVDCIKKMEAFYELNPSFGKANKSSDYEKTIEGFVSSVEMQKEMDSQAREKELLRERFSQQMRPDWNRVDHSIQHIKYDGQDIFYLNDDYHEIVGESGIKINNGYQKNDPYFNKDVQFVFTDNAQAYMKAQGLSSEDIDTSRCLLNVSDKNGNQAAVRTDKYGHVNFNAFGLVVKKLQQDSEGNWLAKEGQFLDNDKDFELFKELNEHMFERLSLHMDSIIQFPSQIALGKAALPERFAQWLKKELSERFSLVCDIETNHRMGYEGFGLRVNGVVHSEEEKVKYGESFKQEIIDTLRGIYGEDVVIKSVGEFASDCKKYRENLMLSLSNTCMVSHSLAVEKLYFYQGVLQDVTHTLAPEVNEREYRYRDKEGVYTLSVKTREHIDEQWRQLKEGCEKLQMELQRLVGYEGSRHVHFGTATHIPLITDNEIVIMDGDMVHAYLRKDQDTGKIVKQEESEGLEHYQTNCLRGIPASNIQSVLAALSERIMSSDMDEHAGRNVETNLHFDREGKLYLQYDKESGKQTRRDYKAEKYMLRSVDTDANDFRGVDDNKKDSIYYEESVSNIDKANDDICRTKDQELLDVIDMSMVMQVGKTNVQDPDIAGNVYGKEEDTELQQGIDMDF